MQSDQPLSQTSWKEHQKVCAYCADGKPLCNRGHKLVAKLCDYPDCDNSKPCPEHVGNADAPNPVSDQPLADAMDSNKLAEKIFNLFPRGRTVPDDLSCRAEDGPTLAALLESFRNKPAVISADARGWAERVDALYREYGQYVNVSMIAALLESFRAETLEQVRDYVAEEMDDWGGPERKVLNGIRDKILARLKNPAPHAAELREQALDLANDEYNKLRKNLGYPPLDNKGRWIFEAERAKLESGK